MWVQDPSYVPDNVLTLRVSGPGSIELDYGGNTFAVTTTAQYSISPGTPVTVTAVLNSSEFVRWTINSSAAPNPFSTSADTNAFNMAGDYDLTAVFKINSLPPSDGTYYITATSDAGSTISPSGVVAVPKGADKTFTFSAKNGYYVSAVIVDGKSLSIGQIDAGSYTFMDVNMNHTIEVRSIAGTRGDLILKIEVMTGEGYAEYSINGSLYTKYTGVVGLPDFADIGVKAYAGEGFEFEKWVTPAVLTTPEIFFEDNGASLNLELYFSDSGSGAGSDDGWIWWVVALILVLLLAGTFLWLFFFYRRYYDVIKTDVKIEGADRVHRKSEYRFKAEGATGTAFYRIGEDDDAVWKQILPGPDGEYAIPRGEITDKVTIEFR